MDYKNMSDSELADIMVNYIGRVEHLMKIIGMYIEGNRNFTSEAIRREYSLLKNELREDADYLRLNRNQQGSNLYMGYFKPSIIEASAYGFRVPVNGKVNQDMYSAVEEASYRLKKHMSIEEWGERM